MYKYATKHAISNKTIHEEDLSNIQIGSNHLNDTFFTINKHLNSDLEFDPVSFNYLFKELIENRNINIELKAIMFAECESYLRKSIRLAINNVDGLKALNLFEYGVKNKILTYKNKIGATRFQNIIQLACYLKQFEWAEMFQSNYGKLVANEHAAESELMTVVQLSFGRLNYNALADIILLNDFKFFPFRCQSRWFLISTYLITFDNLDFFDSQLSNFTQFIYYNKNKLSVKNFEGSLNLAKIFRAYISKPDFSLEEEVAKYKNIVFKNRLPEFFEERKRYVKENGITVS